MKNVNKNPTTKKLDEKDIDQAYKKLSEEHAKEFYKKPAEFKRDCFDRPLTFGLSSFFAVEFS